MAQDRLNEGWIGETPRFDEDSMRQWCADKNRWAESFGFDWWYYVSMRPQGLFKIPEIVKLDGWRAREERARAKGRPVQYFRSEGPEAREVHDRVARIMHQNPLMTQDEFNRLVDEGRL